MRIAERETDLYAVWLVQLIEFALLLCYAGGYRFQLNCYKVWRTCGGADRSTKTSPHHTTLIVDGNRVCRPQIKLNLWTRRVLL